jgi:3-oxoacyl-[acyl-carrier-protein] synthase III
MSAKRIVPAGITGIGMSFPDKVMTNADFEKIVETNDQGRTPEDPSIPAYWDARMKESYDQRIRERDRRLGRQVPTPLP